MEKMEAITLGWKQVGYRKKDEDFTRSTEPSTYSLLECLIFLSSEAGTVEGWNCERKTEDSSGKALDFRALS